ncbi:hypothetical protein PHYPO_G00032180 [Pangasianodon hypophthalmus]|uniref:Adrenomedullin n=1 Tax=Pangasianodon hypophthalmus TaxID=310915 RepID=A0A5N5MJU6_PANHP|nr:hypothetical protein PHYPO_G00032180 [Pangasianodon hypophthalmus]
MRRGSYVMEMTVMLLLLMPLTAAMAFQHKHRPHTDTISLERSIQMSIDPAAETHSTFTHSEMANTPLLQSTSDMLLQSILMQSKNAQTRLRRRRAPSKGCQFGTCQMHNLASTLYRMGQTNNKEQSKGAGDPNGYGR